MRHEHEEVEVGVVCLMSCTIFDARKRSGGDLCADARRYRHLHCAWNCESMCGLPDELHDPQHEEEVRREVIH